MEKLPKLPTDILVLVNGQLWDDKVKSTYRTDIGTKLEIEAYFMTLEPTASIDKVIRFLDEPKVRIKMDNKELYYGKLPWKGEFIVTEDWFKFPVTFKTFEFDYAGGDKVEVIGWRVYGFFPFLISLPGRRYVTTTYDAHKVVSISKKIE
ncbi:MAG: hypothetical protein QXW39_07390 [Candidatus Bathyarchaeia archaeon]